MFVIPVLVDGARLPKAAELPDPIKPLVRRQAIELRNAHFGRDAEALIAKVREAFTRPPAARHHWRMVALAGTAAAAILIVGSTAVYWNWPADPTAKRDSEPNETIWVGSRAPQIDAVGAAPKQQRLADAEADAKRRAEEAEQQRLATLKAEQERKARADAEADAKRKADQAEQQRLAALKAEQERKARADADAEAKRKAEDKLFVKQTLGLELSILTEELRRSFKISDSVNKGVVITAIDAGSPAEEKRLKAGDVIINVEHEPVTDPDTVQQRIGTLKEAGKKFALLWVSDTEFKMRFVALRLNN